MVALVVVGVCSLKYMVGILVCVCVGVGLLESIHYYSASNDNEELISKKKIKKKSQRYLQSVSLEKKKVVIDFQSTGQSLDSNWTVIGQ